MSPLQTKLFPDTEPTPTGGSGMLADYSVLASPFKQRLATLIVRGFWYSERVGLSWAYRNSKLGIGYIQLKVSKRGKNSIIGTPRANEIPKSEKFLEGRVPTPSELINDPVAMEKYGLLKTPSAMDAYSENLEKKEQKFGNSGTLAQEVKPGFVEQRWPRLLLTPSTVDIGVSHDRIRKRTEYRNSIGRQYVAGCLTEQIDGLLPTPSASDVQGAPKREDQISQNQSGGWTRTSDSTGTNFGAKLQDVAPIISSDKRRKQLSPLFVMEMMGFPVYWTAWPFLKQSSHESFDSNHK